jgi:hypothetical protein
MSAAQQYLVAELGPFAYYFDRAQVSSAEALAEFGAGVDAMGGVIAFKDREGAEIPVLSVNHDFGLQDEVDRARRFALLVQGEGVRYGFLCDNLVTLAASQVSLLPMPQALQTPESPVAQLAYRKGPIETAKIGYLIDTNKLAVVLGLATVLF